MRWNEMRCEQYLTRKLTYKVRLHPRPPPRTHRHCHFQRRKALRLRSWHTASMGHRQAPRCGCTIVRLHSIPPSKQSSFPPFSSHGTQTARAYACRSGNITGHPKHVHKACAAGADLIIAQGGEAGGHTGDIATSVLVPACADICTRYTSPVTGKPVVLVAAGGVNDGRSVVSALMLGASGVWVGTRFIVAVESKAPKSFKEEYVLFCFRFFFWDLRPYVLRGDEYADFVITQSNQSILRLLDQIDYLVWTTLTRPA
jgi:hypothetical protein